VSLKTFKTLTTDSTDLPVGLNRGCGYASRTKVLEARREWARRERRSVEMVGFRPQSFSGERKQVCESSAGACCARTTSATDVVAKAMASCSARLIGGRALPAAVYPEAHLFASRRLAP
jgi:hypothetical protein